MLEIILVHIARSITFLFIEAYLHTFVNSEMCIIYERHILENILRIFS